MHFQDLAALLLPSEQRLLKKLNTPQKIQDYLDTLPINFEVDGETYMSPRRVLQTGMAHCFEGALLAAAALAYHGKEPLLMDFQTLPYDEDHVIALFRQHGGWGAISKTNHAILRYRDPVYRTPRELALSFFHEYIMDDGGKTMRAYSAPFDLGRFNFARWVTTEDDLYWLVERLDNSKHFPVAPKKNLRLLRAASLIERSNLSSTEWQRPKKRR